jgi:hypothetical protein
MAEKKSAESPTSPSEELRYLLEKAIEGVLDNVDKYGWSIPTAFCLSPTGQDIIVVADSLHENKPAEDPKVDMKKRVESILFNIRRMIGRGPASGLRLCPQPQHHDGVGRRPSASWTWPVAWERYEAARHVQPSAIIKPGCGMSRRNRAAPTARDGREGLCLCGPGVQSKSAAGAMSGLPPLRPTREKKCPERGRCHADRRAASAAARQRRM